MARASSDSLRRLLPTGGTLPDRAWAQRHRAILAILWVHVPGLMVFAFVNGVELSHVFGEPAIVAAAAALASLPFTSRRLRAGIATFGLVTSSALLVHFSGGVIEFHFHFFVVVAIVTLYQDWTPFLFAIAYVLLHHGIFGGLYPEDVFNHPPALAHPWRWAALHALFIAGESVALLAAWRYAEQGQRETFRSLHRLNQAQHIAQIGTWNWDPSTDVVEISPEFELMTDEASHPTAITLEDWLSQIPPEERHDIKAALQRAITAGERVVFESMHASPDGETHFFTHVAEATTDPTSRKLCVLGASRDVTEEKRLYSQVLQGQKMEAVGRLAGGIAHDFNNLLAVVINYARFLVDDLNEDDSRRADALEILKAGERGATLTRQLLTFSRKEIIQPEVVDLNTLVHGLEKMLRRTLTESIQLVTKTVPDMPHVRVDLGQVEQVLLNLAVNSRDAMPMGGTLSIESYAQYVDEEMAIQHPGLTPGDYICLAVSDSGVGMSPEVKDRVFEPFFTTKSKDKGTGLGLASVYGIMKQNNGYISVYSEPGIGTTFRMYFPPAEAGAKPRSSPERETWSADGTGEKILVVEDEAPVLELVERILTKNGYRVLTAPSGAAALELIGREKGFALLLTDVILPNISGKELARRSGLPTIFMSGYTDEIVAQQGILAAGERLIQKPFDPTTLMRAVREALDDPPASPGPAYDALKRGLHVLVIEDDPQLKELLRQMLALDDTVGEVSEASTTAEALTLCRAKRPDLIVTDSIVSGPGAVMPGEVLRAEFPSVPIISFSGRDQNKPWADVQIIKSGNGVDSVLDAVRSIARETSNG